MKTVIELQQDLKRCERKKSILSRISSKDRMLKSKTFQSLDKELEQLDIDSVSIDRELSKFEGLMYVGDESKASRVLQRVSKHLDLIHNRKSVLQDAINTLPFK